MRVAAFGLEKTAPLCLLDVISSLICAPDAIGRLTVAFGKRILGEVRLLWDLSKNLGRGRARMSLVVVVVITQNRYIIMRILFERPWKREIFWQWLINQA